MKKIAKLMVATIIIFNSFGVVTPAYADVNNDYVLIDGVKYETKYDVGRGYLQGREDGGIDGYTRGKDNFDNNGNKKYTDFLDRDYRLSITQSYVTSEAYTYLNGYEKGYYVAYEYGFMLGNANMAYTSMNEPKEEPADTVVEEVVVEPEQNIGSEAGRVAGIFAGTSSGEIDYYAGKNISEVENSLENFKNEKSLSERYDFERMRPSYGSEFTSAFEEWYRIAYIDRFGELVTGLTVSDYNYTRIKMSGETWALSKVVGDVYEDVLGVVIPEGAIYGEAYLGADVVTKKISYPTNRFLYVTPGFSIKTYSLNNQTKSEYVQFHKPFDIKIPYYGSDSAGIYELRNGVWQYLYTDISEGEISHTFKPQNYSGGIYTVFVENNYPKFNDVSFSWAHDEIYVLARRGNILATSTSLNPTGYMSRREFVFLVNKIKNPNNLPYTIDREFKDVKTDDLAYNAVNYMVANGYMNGTSEDTFSLDAPMTYNQVGDVLHKITGNNFSWTLVENSMKNDKFYLSKGTTDKSKNITKEEAIYTLFYLFD